MEISRPIEQHAADEAVLPRRSANYHPSIWGEYFLAYPFDAPEIFTEEEGEFRQLKEEVKNMLTAIPDSSLEKLDLIDTIQRLGISYHFENEIKASLASVYRTYDDCKSEDGNDLYTVALRFRLLRQQGHYASSDVFHQFKNSEGKFKEFLVSDFRGMLSLYEAANFMVHGENILEEALKFTTTHLLSMAPNLSGFLGAQLNQALKQPIQKTLTRVGARQFMSIYEENEARNKVLLYFAKLDFNRLQKLHQKELSELTKWWKRIDCKGNFPFARDRLVENYFWALAAHFEPQYCLGRRILTKVIAITTIIDDTFDVYGTLDELILFTDAIERWDIEASNELPSYMKHCYQALLDVYSEMEEELVNKGGNSEFVSYSKTEMKKVVRAYFIEAYWFHSGYVPTTKEYMKVALTSCCYAMAATVSFVCMRDLVTKKDMEWTTNEPLAIRAASTILRLMNDVVGHEFEQERGHLASIVECYMSENGVTEKEAVDEFKKQVRNAWKDINEECLNPTAVPMPLLERIINWARFINLVYKDADGYTHSTTKTKDLITMVFVDPVAF